MKKFFALFVSIALVVGLIPYFAITSKAAYDLNNVQSANELCEIRDDLNSGVLPATTDIYFASKVVIDLKGINWEPIIHYQGHIYGNGATITGLFINPYEGYLGNNPTYSYFNSLNNVGFISVMDHGVIEGLTILVDHIEGNQLVGAFCGQAMSSYIHDCNVGAANTEWDLQSGVIIGLDAVGGFAGGFSCGNRGTYSNYDEFGGVYGGTTDADTEGSIINCTTHFPLQIYATGQDSRDPANLYGVNMLAPSTVYDNAPDWIWSNLIPVNSAIGDFPSSTYAGCFAGGFAGLVWETPSNFYNCENNAFVDAYYSSAGGIIGFIMNGAIVRRCTNNGYIKGNDNEYTAIPATGTDNVWFNLINGYGKSLYGENLNWHTECNMSIGGLVGCCSVETVIEECSNLGPVQGDRYVAGIVGHILQAFGGGYDCRYTRVTNCFNSGPIGTDYDLIVGGIAGGIEDFDVFSSAGPCPYCNNGTSTSSASGYCDNIIENCYNTGELYTKGIQFPYESIYNSSGTTATFHYGGIAGFNSGVIRNCYSSLDGTQYPVSICFYNTGLIEHCFGKGDYAEGVNLGLNSTVSDYGTFVDAVGSLPTDYFELVNPGTLSSSSSLIDELNRWVADNVMYQVYIDFDQYACFSYFGWKKSENGKYDDFGTRVNLYRITYYANGGNSYSNNTVQYGSGIVILYRWVPQLTGSTFSCWENLNDNTRYAPGVRMIVTQDTVLSAVWDAAEEYRYKIIYDTNGGTGGPGVQMASGYVLLSTVQPTRTGCNFLGWASSPTAAAPDYFTGQYYYIGQNLTLYALWDGAFTITFNDNGGSGGPGSMTGYGLVTLPSASDSPSLRGSTFLGWTETPLAVNPVYYTAGSQYNLTQDVTLYAYWQVNTGATGSTALASGDSGVRGAELVWTITTSTGVEWIGLTNSYQNSNGSNYGSTSYYKYSDYLDVDGTTSVSDSGDVRTWIITVPLSYVGNDDIVVQNWSITSKAKGEKQWEAVDIDSENVKADGTVDITVARSKALLDQTQSSGSEVTYEPYTLISFESDSESAGVGDYVYLIVQTTPDVSKVRISYTNASTGKKKSNTYQTSSSSVVSYETSDTGDSVCWTIRYKVSAPAQDNVFYAECRGTQWACETPLTLTVT